MSKSSSIKGSFAKFWSETARFTVIASAKCWSMYPRRPSLPRTSMRWSWITIGVGLCFDCFLVWNERVCTGSDSDWNWSSGGLLRKCSCMRMLLPKVYCFLSACTSTADCPTCAIAWTWWRHVFCSDPISLSVKSKTTPTQSLLQGSTVSLVPTGTLWWTVPGVTVTFLLSGTRSLKASCVWEPS